MQTDLPDRIRDALRADEIGATDLDQPAMRGPSPSGIRSVRVLAASAAVVVVAVVSIVVSLVATGHGNEGAAGRPDAMAGVAGYRWDVTGVRDARGTLSVPRGLHAEIGFARTGIMLGSDGVNTLAGRYHATATGYRVGVSAISAVGTASPDPVRDRVTAAVDAMFAVTAAGSGATDPPDTAVAVALSGNTLTLRRGAVVLTLARAGVQPDAGMTSASTAGPDAVTCTGGHTQQGFALSIASGARGAASPEAALKYLVDHDSDLGLGAYRSSEWTIRHTSANAATATSRQPTAMIKLVRLPGKGWFAESGYTCS